MHRGFVVLHRRLLEWEWYHDHNVTRLFIHLLLRANHAPKKWQGQTINRGQVLSGRIQLSSETGLSERTVRTCLNKLKTTSDLTIKTTNRYSIYTICNYDKWQNQETNRPAKRPATRHSSDQQPTTNNNNNNDNNKTIEHLFERLWDRYPVKKGKPIAFNHFKAKYKKDENISKKIDIAITNYLKYIKDEKKDKEFIMHGKTFFNHGWLDYEKAETKKEPLSDMIDMGRQEQIERGIINE